LSFAIVLWCVPASIPAVGVQFSGASFHTRRRARAAVSQCVPGRGAAVPIPATGGLDEPNRSAGGDGSPHATVRRGTHLPLSRYVLNRRGPPTQVKYETQMPACTRSSLCRQSEQSPLT
jgi:hypothetical protein